MKQYRKAVEAERRARQTLSNLIAGADRASEELTSDKDVSRGALPKAVVQPQRSAYAGKILGTWCANSTSAAVLWRTVQPKRVPSARVCLRVQVRSGSVSKHEKKRTGCVQVDLPSGKRKQTHYVSHDSRGVVLVRVACDSLPEQFVAHEHFASYLRSCYESFDALFFCKSGADLT